HLCDHADEAEVVGLVRAVEEAEGRIDLLVNNVWAGPQFNPFAPEKFWERPVDDWDTLITVGLRAHYVASHAAVPAMVERGDGLVVNITSVGARAHLHSTLYGMGKAALDKMTHDMAYELRGTGVSVLSLWPGLVRTKLLLASGLTEFEGVSINDTETPELQGRVLAAVAADPSTPQRSGTALLTAELCTEYGIFDEGATPVSPRTMFGVGPGHEPVGP
ncbi:MAG: SDR family NAD(P)-dependent oxidoreductase, partial [Nocardioides sp.]|uniref:SDR family NAD(P)-dependent oxidoreductase n=1 Tax=Nocardioides sp. TaxID=35761 RepID=UPI003F0AF109